MIGAMSTLGLSVACSDASLMASASSVPSEPGGFVSALWRSTAKAACEADGIGQGRRNQSSLKAAVFRYCGAVLRIGLAGARAENEAQTPFVKPRHRCVQGRSSVRHRLMLVDSRGGPCWLASERPAKSIQA